MNGVKLFILIFGITILGLIAKSPSHVYADCGVNPIGHDIHDYAGAVIELFYRNYEDGYLYQANGPVGVKVVTGTTDTLAGNITRLSGEDNRVLDRRLMTTFGLRDTKDDTNFNGGKGCGFGYGSDNTLVILGYGNSSWPYDTPGTTNWTLDCDMSIEGHKEPQKFSIWGTGTPVQSPGDTSGALRSESDGSWWDVSEIQPQNGETAYLALVYHEAAPPDRQPTISLRSSCDGKEVGIFINDPDGGRSVVDINVSGPGGGDINPSPTWDNNIWHTLDMSGYRIQYVTRTVTVTTTGNNTRGSPVTKTISYGPCDSAPRISVTQSCSYKGFTITASDPDPGNFNVQYSVNGDPWVTRSLSSNPDTLVISLASRDQYRSYNIVVRTFGRDPSGGSGIERTDTTTYGPCEHHPTGEAAADCETLTGNVTDDDNTIRPRRPLQVRIYKDALGMPEGPNSRFNLDQYPSPTAILTTKLNGDFSLDISSYTDASIHNYKVYARDINDNGVAQHWDWIATLKPVCKPIKCSFEPTYIEVGVPTDVKFKMTYYPGKNGTPQTLNTTDNKLNLTIKKPTSIFYDPPGYEAYAPTEFGGGDGISPSAVHDMGTIIGNVVADYDAHFSLTNVPDELIEQCGPFSVIARPYVTVFGNDITAGGGFSGSTCDNPAKISTYFSTINQPQSGASAQFAAYALGEITGFATAKMRAPPFTAPRYGKGLTFANIKDGANFPAGIYGGSFGASDFCVPDYWALSSKAVEDKFIDRESPEEIYIGEKTGPVGPVIRKIAAIIGPTTIYNQVAVFVDGDLWIRSDIKYDDTPNSWEVGKLPALFVIVKGDIKIAHNVSRLDGVYISLPSVTGGGTIVTCAGPNTWDEYIPDHKRQLLPGGDPSHRGDCTQKQLTVNGAFIAQKIKLLRTGSSLMYSSVGEHPATNLSEHLCGSASTNVPNFDGNKRVCSAEVFNFSPELYLADTCKIFLNCGPTPPDDSITGMPPIL